MKGSGDKCFEKWHTTLDLDVGEEQDRGQLCDGLAQSVDRAPGWNSLQTLPSQIVFVSLYLVETKVSHDCGTAGEWTQWRGLTIWDDRPGSPTRSVTSCRSDYTWYTLKEKVRTCLSVNSNCSPAGGGNGLTRRRGIYLKDCRSHSRIKIPCIYFCADFLNASE